MLQNPHKVTQAYQQLTNKPWLCKYKLKSLEKQKCLNKGLNCKHVISIKIVKCNITEQHPAIWQQIKLIILIKFSKILPLLFYKECMYFIVYIRKTCRTLACKCLLSVLLFIILNHTTLWLRRILFDRIMQLMHRKSDFNKKVMQFRS